jgi:hypothetical protein
MLVPLYGFLHGDTLGLIVLVQDHDPVATIADSLQEAASMRVIPGQKMRVWHNGKALDPALTVQQARIAPLDRIDVRPEAFS